MRASCSNVSRSVTSGINIVSSSQSESSCEIAAFCFVCCLDNGDCLCRTIPPFNARRAKDVLEKVVRVSVALLATDVMYMGMLAAGILDEGEFIGEAFEGISSGLDAGRRLEASMSENETAWAR